MMCPLVLDAECVLMMFPSRHSQKRSMDYIDVLGPSTGRVEPFSCFDRTSYELYRIKKIAMFTFVLEYVFFLSFL